MEVDFEVAPVKLSVSCSAFHDRASLLIALVDAVHDQTPSFSCNTCETAQKDFINGKQRTETRPTRSFSTMARRTRTGHCTSAML